MVKEFDHGARYPGQTFRSAYRGIALVGPYYRIIKEIEVCSFGIRLQGRKSSSD